MIGVIDTSALIRLFIPDGPVPEGMNHFFRGVERGQNIALAPELLLLEAASVIQKKRHLGEIADEEAPHILGDIISMPIRFQSHGPLIVSAMDIAERDQITVYDAVYIALALEQGAVLFSVDQELNRIADKYQLCPQK